MAVSAADAAHLLRRSGFGVDPAKLAELMALSTREAAVDRVLDLSKAPPVAMPVGTSYTDDAIGTWWKMTEWWMERMRTTPTPIVEKLMLFWHGHFVSSLEKVDVGLLVQQHLTMRTHATGNFHSMAQAMSVDPAMLWYLDNVLNTVWSPQENFGRELMELFTLGVGNYSQTDVVSMTRAWTGHSVDDGWRKYAFRSTWHDNSTKVLFGKAAKNWNGPAALTDVLKGTKASQSARFITAKLFSYFAYPVTPADPVVTSLASTFQSSGLDIMKLVRAIFRSSAFWSTTARRALVRSPMEWFVAGLQATGLSTATVPPYTVMNRVGQVPFMAPDVSGWKQNEYWLSTAGMWGRSQWATYVRYYAWQSGLFADLATAAPATVATEGFKRFGIVDPSPTTRAAIEAWAAKAQADFEGWSIPFNLVQLLLLSPDFQVA